MIEEQLSLSDSVDITHEPNAGASEKSKYEIVSPHGLFKNGRQYKQGETVMLDKKTGANFIASGDIKEV